MSITTKVLADANRQQPILIIHFSLDSVFFQRSNTNIMQKNKLCKFLVLAKRAEWAADLADLADLRGFRILAKARKAQVV